VPSRDARLLLAAACCRSLLLGVTGVLLGTHLARAGLDPRAVGLATSAGLWGGALAALLTTAFGDRLGRRRVLAALGVLTALGALAFAFARDLPLAALAAFAGMLNGIGRDRGAAPVLDQAMLGGAADGHARTRLFAVYGVLQDAGGALGALLASAPFVAGAALGWTELASSRVAMVAVAALALGSALLALPLSPAVEVTAAERRLPLSPATRGALWRVSGLFGLDALGSGFLASSLIAFFLHERFAVREAELGALFFGARALNALSHFAAAWLARRIGLVNTMVWTHLPSSLLLVTVAFAPSFPVAALLFLLREGFVEMDVPTRQSFLMGLVAPHERTRAAGVTQLVRLAGWAVGPAVAGALMGGGALWAPLVAGASLKITYDLLLWRAFRHVVV
jgi:MFS family permease